MILDRIYDLYAVCLLRDFVPTILPGIKSVDHQTPTKDLNNVLKDLMHQMQANGIMIPKGSPFS